MAGNVFVKLPHTLEVVPMSLLLTLNKYLPTGMIQPSKHYPSEFNNSNTTKRCELCLKLTIKTPERRQILWLLLVFLLLNFDKKMVFWDHRDEFFTLCFINGSISGLLTAVTMIWNPLRANLIGQFICGLPLAKFTPLLPE